MSLRKRSLTLDRHRTSVALEPIFWTLLERAAAERGSSLAALVAEIDRARVAAGQDNLSSAVRVWLVERLLEKLPSPLGEGGGAAAG